MSVSTTDGTRTFPASYAQESFVMSGGAVHEQSAINVPAVVRIGTDVELARLQQILDALVARHSALRTVLIRTPDGRVRQRVQPSGALPLTVIEHDGSLDSQLPRLLLAGSERPFVLENSALARAELHVLAGQRVLVIWLHHAVSDLVSVKVLADEVQRLCRGAAPPPTGLPLSEVAQQERATRATARQWRYWTQALSSADQHLGMAYPAGTPHWTVRPALPRLPGDVLDALERLAAAHRTTLTTVLAAAVIGAHAGAANSDRVVIGLTVSNRERPGLRSTVGCLADQIPLVVDIGGRPSFQELVGRVREGLLDAYDHRLPLGLLLPLLDRRTPPVFAVNLNFLPPGRGGADPEPGGGVELPFGITKRRSDPWWLGDAVLAYRPRIDSCGLGGEIEGDAHLHGPERVHQLAGHFATVLATVARTPGVDVRELTAANHDRETGQ
ncbi:hypothetical protein GCM10023322_56210 [Rugosimonospora acidiphila]|uniref:Condensation domain-containing protein n=1 Tax=Rugosimonospora acidiphila TaxID=556531 RepID=A0ABP9SD22_9ACTN